MLKLYNTLSRKIEVFKSIKEKEITNLRGLTYQIARNLINNYYDANKVWKIDLEEVEYKLGASVDLDQEFDLKATSGSVYRFSEPCLNQIIDICKDSHLIGISLFTCHFDRAVQLTQAIKSKLDIPVMWGGIHPTIKPDESLHYCDIVCLGEGEEAVAELLGKMEKKENYLNTKNFWFKHNGTIIKNELRPLKEDLNTSPKFYYFFGT